MCVPVIYGLGQMSLEGLHFLWFGLTGVPVLASFTAGCLETVAKYRGGGGGEGRQDTAGQKETSRWRMVVMKCRCGFKLIVGEPCLIS